MEESSNCPECRLQILQNQNQMSSLNMEEEYSEFQLPSSRSFLVGDNNKKDNFPSTSQSSSSTMSIGPFKSCHQPQAQGYQAEQLANNSNNMSSSTSHSDTSNLQLLMNLRNSPILNNVPIDNPQHYSTSTNGFSLSLNMKVKPGPSSSSSTMTMNQIGSTPEILPTSHSNSSSSICCPKYCTTCAVLDLPTNEKFYRPSLPRPSVYPSLFYGQGPLPGFSPISEWGNCTSADFTPYSYAPFQHQQSQADFFNPSTNVLLENHLNPKSSSSLQSCAFPSFSPGSSSNMLLMANPPSPQLQRSQRLTTSTSTASKDYREKSIPKESQCSVIHPEKNGECFLNIQNMQHRNFSSVSNELTSINSQIQNHLLEKEGRCSIVDVQLPIQNESPTDEGRSPRPIELIEVEIIKSKMGESEHSNLRVNEFDRLNLTKEDSVIVENIDLENDNATHPLVIEKRKKIASICISSSDSDDGRQSNDSDSDAGSYVSHNDLAVEDNEEEENEGEETCNQCKIDERLEGPNKCIICWDSVFPEDCPSPPQLVNILENIHEDITAEDLDITVSSGDIEIGGIEDEVRDFQHKKSFCRAKMAISRFGFLFGISTKDVLNLLENNERRENEEKKSNKEFVYFCSRCGKLALLMDSLEKQMSSTAFLLNSILHPSYNNFEKKGFPLPVLRPENHPTSFNVETEVETNILNSLSCVHENSISENSESKEITSIEKSTQTDDSLTPIDNSFNNTRSTSPIISDNLSISNNILENGEFHIVNEENEKLGNQKEFISDNIDKGVENIMVCMESIESSFPVQKDLTDGKVENSFPNLSSDTSESSLIKTEGLLLGSSKENANQLNCVHIPLFESNYSPGPLQNSLNSNTSSNEGEESPQSTERLNQQLKKIVENSEIINNKRFYLCDECGKALCSKRTLGNHLRRHANQLKMKCSTCMKGFPSKNSLIVHMRSHNGEKPYSCPHCQKTFSTKSNMSAHSEICPEKIDKLENSKSQLSPPPPSEDFKIVEGEKIGGSNGRFSCDKCGLSFRQKMRYSKHLEKGCRPHLLICNICNKRFWKKSEIRSHLRAHEGIKPFPCPECGISFSTKGNLSAHLRTHSNVKRFNCMVCVKGFNRKFALQLHMNRHNGIKPFVCKTCNKSFFDPSNLLNHRKTHCQKT